MFDKSYEIGDSCLLFMVESNNNQGSARVFWLGWVPGYRVPGYRPIPIKFQKIWVPMGTGYRPAKKLWVPKSIEYQQKNFWVPMGTGYRPNKKFWVAMGTGYRLEKKFWVPMGTGYRKNFQLCRPLTITLRVMGHKPIFSLTSLILKTVVFWKISRNI